MVSTDEWLVKGVRLNAETCSLTVRDNRGKVDSEVCKLICLHSGAPLQLPRWAVTKYEWVITPFQAMARHDEHDILVAEWV